MKKITATIALLALLIVPVAYALSTTTQVYFNVASVVAYTLTLPGESAVDATGGGAATTAIEFNTSTGNQNNVDAKVVGGTVQSDGTPIFKFDNTGTVDLNISVVLNTATNDCINLTGADTYEGASTGAQIGTSNITVVNDFTPAAGYKNWYMKADFTNCLASDTSIRTLTSYGVQS